MRYILLCERPVRKEGLSLHRKNDKNMANNGYKKEFTCGNVTVVENKNYQWGVIDSQGNVVVPFGKYGWIDKFDSGLARVRTHKQSGKAGTNDIGIITDQEEEKPSVIFGRENIQNYYNEDRKKHPENYAKWGIINEKGEEVLPVIYDDVWNFYGKNRYSVRVEKNGEFSDIYFCDLNPSLPKSYRRKTSHHSSYDYCSHYHYGEYAGSYAQDVMGYSDEDINDAFDGDPDAYWNID